MKSHFRFVHFLLFLFLSSCQPRIMKELDHIESLLDSKPDSALALVLDIHPDRMKSEEALARHSLLLSIALDKNYIDLQSDSIIKKALDYYSVRKISPYRMKAWYYEGLIQYNRGDYTSSIVSLEKADGDAEFLEDFYYEGLINRKKSSIFNTWFNMPAAIASQEKALNAFKKAGKDEHALYSTLALGTEWFNYHDYNKAKDYFDSIKNNTDNPFLLGRCDLRLASILIEKGDSTINALSAFRTVPKRLFDLYDYGYYAIALERAGEADSASFWMNKGYERARDESDSASLDYMFSGIAFNRGDYKLAYSLVKHATDIQNSHTQSILQESLNTALKDYYMGKLALEQEKAARERDNRIWRAFFVLLFIIVIVAVFLRSLKKKNQLLELQIAQFAAVQQENKGYKQEKALLIGNLFSERLHHLDELSNEYFAADEKEKKDIVFNTFKRYLEQFRSDKDAFNSLEQDLNTYEDGIMDKLGVQVPRISGEKRRIISLFFAGISYETIQLICNSTSIESLRMLRSRFRKEINDANAPDAERFLSLLETKKRSASRQHKE